MHRHLARSGQWHAQTAWRQGPDCRYPACGSRRRVLPRYPWVGLAAWDAQQRRQQRARAPGQALPRSTEAAAQQGPPEVRPIRAWPRHYPDPAPRRGERPDWPDPADLWPARNAPVAAARPRRPRPAQELLLAQPRPPPPHRPEKARPSCRVILTQPAAFLPAQHHIGGAGQHNGRQQPA